MKKVLSLLLAFAILALTLMTAGCARDFEDYLEADLRRFVTFRLEDFTGKTIKIEGTFESFSREDAIHEIRYEQLAASYYDTKKDVDTYVGKPGYGDAVYIYYSLSATEGGETIASNMNNTEGVQAVNVGYWEFPEKNVGADGKPLFLALFCNKQLSDAIMTMTPAERTYSSENAPAFAKEGDVLRVTFEMHRKDDSLYADNYNLLRIDTSDKQSVIRRYGEAFYNALFSTPIGEKQTVTGVIKNDKGEDVEVTYKNMVVDHVAKETYTTVKIDLPEDAFAKDEYSQTLVALNGKSVYLSVCIDNYINYTVPALNGDFVKNDCGYKTDETDSDKVVEEYIQYKLDSWEKEHEELVKQVGMETFMAEFYSSELVKRIAKSPYEKHYNYIIDEVTAQYEEARLEAAEKNEPFGYASVDAYAPVVLEYSVSEYPTLVAYAEEIARETTAYRTVVFAMAQMAGVRMTPSDLKAERDSMLAYYVEYFQELYPDVIITEQMIVEDYFAGKYGSEENWVWSINWSITYGELTDYVYAHNTWDYVRE